MVRFLCEKLLDGTNFTQSDKFVFKGFQKGRRLNGYWRWLKLAHPKFREDLLAEAERLHLI